MKKNICLLVSALFVLVQNCELSYGMEVQMLDQEQWAEWFEEAEVFEAVDPSVDYAEKMDRLSLQEKPYPCLFEAYHTCCDGKCVLMKDKNLASSRKVKLFCAPCQDPNYVTTGFPISPCMKECLVCPQEKFSSSRDNGPTSVSSSYPKGCKTYYCYRYGKWFKLCRGHNIAHMDTLTHAGILSTDDPENMAPQNEKYNNPIRKDFERKFRIKQVSEGVITEKGVRYKELSVYHEDNIYTVCEDEYGNKPTDVPLPEGFILIVYTKAGDIDEVYYFPNFVDYKNLKPTDETYVAAFCNQYKMPIGKWLLKYSAIQGNPCDQQRCVCELKSVCEEIKLSGPSLFATFDDVNMPKKAREALVGGLYELNLQAAASLECCGFENQLDLVGFYAQPQCSFVSSTSMDVDDLVVNTPRNPEVAKAVFTIVESRACSKNTTVEDKYRILSAVREHSFLSDEQTENKWSEEFYKNTSKEGIHLRQLDKITDHDGYNSMKSSTGSLGSQ